MVRFSSLFVKILFVCLKFILSGISYHSLAAPLNKNLSSLATPSFENLPRYIVVKSDIWCPFTCQPSSLNPGFGVELLQLLYSRYFIDITYSILNWKRVLLELSTGANHATIGTAPDESPNLIFPQQPFYALRVCAYTLAESSWVFTGVDSLKNIRLAVVQNYKYSEEIDEYIDSKKNDKKSLEIISDEDPVTRMILMLTRKRFHAFLEYESIMDYQLALNAIPGIDKIKKSGCTKNMINLYIGFSPAFAHSKILAELFDQEFAKLRKTNDYQKLLRKYHLRDYNE